MDSFSPPPTITRPSLSLCCRAKGEGRSVPRRSAQPHARGEKGCAASKGRPSDSKPVRTRRRTQLKGRSPRTKQRREPKDHSPIRQQARRQAAGRQADRQAGRRASTQHASRQASGKQAGRQAGKQAARPASSVLSAGASSTHASARRGPKTAVMTRRQAGTHQRR